MNQLNDEPIDWERYRPYLMMMARLQLELPLQGKVHPSDLVQQTMIEAHQSRQQFRGTSEGERAAWLRQILARNLADEIRRFGRQKRNVALEKSLNEKLDQSSIALERWLTSREVSPSEHLIRGESLLQLARALAVLPEDQRRAIELFHLQGKTSAETARELVRSEIAVAGLLRRGLRNLREQMCEPVEE